MGENENEGVAFIPKLEMLQVHPTVVKASRPLEWVSMIDDNG
jgi:hypothetical protein